MIKEIEERRSIRKFSEEPISEEVIRQIIESAIKAPSAKNQQPWKFVVVQGAAKQEMLSVFEKTLQEGAEAFALLPNHTQFLNGARNTLAIMKQAPISIFVLNTEGKGLFAPLSVEERIAESVNVQSIGAAIQNMLLAATALGVGSLWIGDIFFAYPQLSEWLAEEGDLLAAISFGTPLETPFARPRKPLADVVSWRK